LFRDPSRQDLESLYHASWSDPERHIDETGATDSDLAKTYIARLARSIGRKDLRGMRILDYGAGRGALLRALLDAGSEACGIEPYGYRFLQAKGYTVYPSIGDLPSGIAFDGIVLLDVIEHLKNPRKVLASCKRLLAENGWIYISTPNAAGIKARLARDRWGELYNRSHVFFFSPKTLRGLVTHSGFHNVRRLTWFVNYRRHPAVSVLHWVLQSTRMDGELRFLGHA
jgi:2-polyprenyl-3-methyl-5-hydroxy-6-metoxy-1,4-benzoquinol methylase